MNDRWGIGVMALYDQSQGGIYKNNYISVSNGFNKVQMLPETKVLA